MRFTAASILAFAAGALATANPSSSVVYDVVTSYTTYCPEATSIVAGGSTIHVTTPGTVTLSGGSYTVTRPLMSSTITVCNSCSSSSAPVPYSTGGLKPATTSVAPAGSSKTTTSAVTPAYTGGASHAAAGAGAGLAAVFGVAAFLL